MSLRAQKRRDNPYPTVYRLSADTITQVIVKRNLIQIGLPKYKPLADFNIFIICFSLSMDVLIISTMSLKNSFV